jgi:PAS domain S-box-containing protein
MGEPALKADPDAERELFGRRLCRAEERVQILERMLEDRAREAFLASEQLRTTERSLAELFRAVPGAIIVIGESGLIEAVNGETMRLLGYDEAELIGHAHAKVFASAQGFSSKELGRGPSGDHVLRAEREVRTKAGQHVPVLLSATLLGTDEGAAVVCVAIDLSERKKLETELLHAHKLESIGRLAAGLAHEINTPIQFISDSVRFARDAILDLAPVHRGYRKLKVSAQAVPELEEVLAELTQIDAIADVTFLLDQLPGALERALEGLQRVAGIVRATKDFAYPTTRERRTANINKALTSTLTIGRSEYAELADIELDLGELPLVPCHIGELNQVFLNLVINAAHAIQDRRRGGRGRISIRTRVEGAHVVVSVGDDGDGVPEAIKNLIFDPFFTTKEVGRGSGQGLSIAHSVVVERHGGSLSFETAIGQGTTFFVRIPLATSHPSNAPNSRLSPRSER